MKYGYVSWEGSSYMNLEMYYCFYDGFDYLVIF